MDLHLRFPETYPIRPGDDINLELVLENSYDGSALKLMYGAWRFVCANGLVIGEIINRLRQVHTMRLDDKRIISDFTFYIKTWKEETLPMLRSFAEVGLTKKEGLDLIESFRIADKWKQAIAQRWVSEELIDTASAQSRQERTAWALLNVITWVTTHVKMSYGVERNIQAQMMRNFIRKGR